MARFKVYYDGGKEFDSSKGGPMPGRGVQAVVQDHPEVTSEIVTACDYYVKMKDGRWKGVDIFGLFDWLLDSGLVLFGRTIGRQEYMDICNRALKDKAGWLPREKRFV